MLIFCIAVRNLFRHPVKTILIMSLIAVGTSLFFCANAIFESTSRGLETSFIGSLTGDFAVSAQGEESFGVFGSEVPIVSEYQSIPPITDFTTVSNLLNGEQSIQAWTPIVSAAAQVNVGGYVAMCPVFGVDASTYFSVCSDLTVGKGEFASLSEGGVVLNAELAAVAEKALGRNLKIGEPVVFSMFTNGSFRARRGFYSGIYRYPAPTDIMNQIVLADPSLVRSLCDYTMGYTLSNKMQTEDFFPERVRDLDDLFADAEDSITAPVAELSLNELEATLADTEEREAMVLTDAAAWSFVLVRVKPHFDADAVRRSVAHTLTRAQVDVRVMSWREAAGASVLMIFAVRMAFNVGIGVLVLGAGLIVMNALVISVLERKDEIGAMRALGAGRGFIRALFVLETMIQTVAATVIGIICGALLSAFLARRGIPLSNPILISLFGGTTISPLVELRSILTHFTGAVLIASFAWIYPVSVALRIQPVSAMTKE